MLSIVVKRAVQGAVLVSLMGSVCGAQSFGDGSFGDGNVSNPATSQPKPAPSTGGSAGGGFEAGSFETGAGGSTPIGLAPPVESTGPVTGGVVGGADFPGGNVLPETPQTEVVNQPPKPQPNPTPPANPNTGGIDPQITAFETRDFGVPPQNALRQGQFHAPTPTAIPGGYLVTTANLVAAMNNGTQMLVIDVLGSSYGLPNAYNAPALASAGSFNDRTQQQAAAWLNQISGGNPNVPIVIYCSEPMCWLSYNASLRAIAAGYKQVYWYRGGLQAWQMAGLPMHPAGF